MGGPWESGTADSVGTLATEGEVGWLFFGVSPEWVWLQVRQGALPGGVLVDDAVRFGKGLRPVLAVLVFVAVAVFVAGA